MKIALDVSAVPAEPVGAGVYTLELAIGLAQRCEVELHLIARKGDARWQEVAPSATTHRIVADDRPRRILWEATRAARVARSIGCDVWHGPHYTLPRDPACASIVTVHDLTFFDQPETHERIKVAFFRRAIARNASNASGVICVSATTANRLRAIVADAAPITVAHHGVDHNRFSVGTKSSDDTDQSLLERRGIRAPFLAFVGTV